MRTSAKIRLEGEKESKLLLYTVSRQRVSKFIKLFRGELFWIWTEQMRLNLINELELVVPLRNADDNVFKINYSWINQDVEVAKGERWYNREILWLGNCFWDLSL